MSQRQKLYCGTEIRLCRYMHDLSPRLSLTCFVMAQPRRRSGVPSKALRRFPQLLAARRFVSDGAWGVAAVGPVKVGGALVVSADRCCEVGSVGGRLVLLPIKTNRPNGDPVPGTQSSLRSGKCPVILRASFSTRTRQCAVWLVCAVMRSKPHVGHCEA